jgi:peptidoglycan/LPS O-acetylase OafA/YrhL
MIWVLVIFCVASLLYFNRLGSYENYFIYFMGPYGLGVLAQLSKNYPDIVINRLARILFLIIGFIILVASFQELWLRNILAYAVAIALFFWGDWAYKDQKHFKAYRVVNAILWGSRRSYCAFLLHFAFILLANTIYIGWGMSLRHDGMMALALMLVAVAISWMAANYLYRWVEVPSRNIKL